MEEKIFVAGHKGMVGSAIIRELKKHDAKMVTRSREELNLINQFEVNKFFEKEKPTQVYMAAAKVGGIYANNTYPANFIYENLMVQANVINAAFINGVKKLLFLGSSCIYPREANQPMKEEVLLTGLLEPTNEPYAIAKIAGIKLCESYNRQYGESNGIDYRSVMPTNLYGVGDSYHPENSHVIPALISRFHNARVKKLNKVVIWGTGLARREFLYVDDLAVACVKIMNIDENDYKKKTNAMCTHINVGSGYDISIKELAVIISKVVGYSGSIDFDTSKPDGAPQKLLDSKLVNSLGWRPKINLENGLVATYKNYLEKNESNEKK